MVFSAVSRVSLFEVDDDTDDLVGAVDHVEQNSSLPQHSSRISIIFISSTVVHISMVFHQFCCCPYNEYHAVL